MNGELVTDGQQIHKEGMEKFKGRQMDRETNGERVRKFLGSSFESASDSQVPWVLWARLSESSVCPLGVKGKGPCCFPMGHCGQRERSSVDV